MRTRCWTLLLLAACNRGAVSADVPDGAPVLAPDAGPHDASDDTIAPADVAPSGDPRAVDAPVFRDTSLPPDPSPDLAADRPPVQLDTTPDLSGCGHVGDLCCPDLTCVDPETVCVGSNPATALCKRCGRSQNATNLPCCPGNQCLDGSCCFHPQTANVGPFCVGVGNACFELGSHCASTGSCGPNCGGVDQPCCHGLGVDYCGAGGTACMRAAGAAVASCVACGKMGQPCCQQVASEYSIQPCAVGLRCWADGRCGS